MSLPDVITLSSLVDLQVSLILASSRRSIVEDDTVTVVEGVLLATLA